MGKTEHEKWEEKNLDEIIDTWDHQKNTWDRERKGRGLEAATHLKDQIINARMAWHDSDLAGWRSKIEELQDQRTFILQAPPDKTEFLDRVKELVHDAKREALNHLVLTPLIVQREGNMLPRLETRKDFPERYLWSLLYLAISDQDLKKVVEEMPDTDSLSTEERKSKVAEINAEITKVTDILKSKLVEAETALKEAQPK